MKAHPMIRTLFVFAIIISTLSTGLNAEERASVGIVENINWVNKLYDSDSESIPYNEVLTLSQRVIKQRQFYNNNTLAKVFTLLADAAANTGDLAKSLQFAQDGVSLLNVDKQINLRLLLKVAAGYYYKGKFNSAKEVAERAVAISKKHNNVEWLIYAISYRAMANALLAQHDSALNDIEKVEQLLEQQPSLSDRIALINLLASAHYYLGDNNTAISLYNKVLKLRFESKRVVNIDQTYYHLARSYLALGLLDDAYNAFWEALSFAKKRNAPIRVAYAQSGLGKTHYLQHEYQQALALFNKAEKGFQGYNLTQPYLAVLVDLAKVHQQLNNKALQYRYIKQAERISVTTELTEVQNELHLMAAHMYRDLGQLDKALASYFKYTEKEKLFDRNHRHQTNLNQPNNATSQKRRDFSLQFANQSTLTQEYQVKYQQQRQLISVLIVSIVLLFLLCLWLGFKLRKIKLKHLYDEVEKPIDYIAGPSYSKKLYQYHYKMARRFEYPLAVGYFTIDNWNELTFLFNKKVVAEVVSALAILINDIKEEFVKVGVINEGEYLFLAPHQRPEDLQRNLDKLAKAVKQQLFANLGEFSLKVRYDCQSPSVQDIDPYIFLSRISDSTAPDSNYNL
ncbi:tetratricopeptide repeat protein [Thalassotalea sediminis]|uniref:tetratricopeptide repeat protein n=1 Tax=Thalassotalea sediminis TaxID=1759089 RepID=UPI002573CF92|nr:hypothetical protein [Thalassotalea sediminis]